MSLVFQFIFASMLLAGNPSSSAAIILLNGKIITANQNFTIAEAVAIKKDKIIAVGSNKEITKLANK